MKNKILTVLLLLTSIRAFSQQDSLTTQILKEIPVRDFIYRTPSVFKLDPTDTFRIKEAAREHHTSVPLSDSLLLELFKLTQTEERPCLWTNADFPNSIVVTNRQIKLDYRHILREKGLSKKTDKQNRLQGLANSWNAEVSNFNSSIYVSYISTPLFDKSGNYALVEYGYNCGNLCGRGQIYVYKLVEKKWTPIVLVTNFIN